MVKQLELKNVKSYSVNFTGEQGKSYSVINSSNKGFLSSLQLDNLSYANRSEGSNPKAFDCKLSLVEQDYFGKYVMKKELFNIKGLDTDGIIQFDAQNNTFTVPLNETVEYASCLNDFINNHLELFAQ